jgi:hypothetical protein
MIIDAHCHAGRGDIMNAPWSTEAPLDKYLPRAGRWHYAHDRDSARAQQLR